ncbi:hypothetical protein C0584_00650 [Candidatus Parcubacteria bacterium]|nr:MAG: hypothetical protein C0584_00650 [Candidatus Parcubacteria bacterium]
MKEKTIYSVRKNIIDRGSLLMNRSLGFSDSVKVSAEVIDAVKNKLIKWEELGFNKEALRAYVNLAFALEQIDGLKKHNLLWDIAINVANDIYSAINLGLITWDDLGILSGDLSYDVKECGRNHAIKLTKDLIEGVYSGTVRLDVVDEVNRAIDGKVTSVATISRVLKIDAEKIKELIEIETILN